MDFALYLVTDRSIAGGPLVGGVGGGLGGESDVGPVVDQEPRAVAPRGLAQWPGEREKVAHREILLAELHRPEPGAQALLDDLHQRPPRDRAVRDEIQREVHRHPPLVPARP